MTASTESSDRDSYNLKSNTTWDGLYHSIRYQVREWVRSSHVPLWRGQEEEIIADIVQETMMRTFKYVSNFSLWSKEGETIQSSSLENICEYIAHVQYQHVFFQDSRFVCIQSRNHSFQGYIIIREQFDPLDTVINDTFQEWCCDHLASEIAEIPSDSRRALLIYLANHVCFDVQISHLLQSAFLKRGIQLRDYQQSLPSNPGARSKHKTLLRLAHKRIMRKQEKLNKLENTELVAVEQEFFLASDNHPPEDIMDNPELAALAAELEATAPSTIVDPVFQQTLQGKLLDIQADYYVPVIVAHPIPRKAVRNKRIGRPRRRIHTASEMVESAFNRAQEAIAEHSHEKGNDDHIQGTTLDDPDFDAPGGGDLGLTVLLACLNMGNAHIDPTFQSTLRDKIADHPLLYYVL